MLPLMHTYRIANVAHTLMELCQIMGAEFDATITAPPRRTPTKRTKHKFRSQLSVSDDGVGRAPPPPLRFEQHE